MKANQKKCRDNMPEKPETSKNLLNKYSKLLKYNATKIMYLKNVQLCNKIFMKLVAMNVTRRSPNPSCQ